LKPQANATSVMERFGFLRSISAAWSETDAARHGDSTRHAVRRRHGDKVSIEIEKIGVLDNPVTNEI
jgi:hypothetical protein